MKERQSMKKHFVLHSVPNLYTCSSYPLCFSKLYPKVETKDPA